MNFRVSPLRASLMLVLISTNLLASSCSAPAVLYFPVRREPGLLYLAMLPGKLVLTDGLLRCKGGNGSYLLIWPYGYSYRVSGGKVEILNEEGDTVVRTGEYKQFGGGIVPSVEAYVNEPPPPGLPGPYWLANPIRDN